MTKEERQQLKDLENYLAYYCVTESEKSKGRGRLTKERTLNRKAARKEKRQWQF